MFFSCALLPFSLTPGGKFFRSGKRLGLRHAGPGVCSLVGRALFPCVSTTLYFVRTSQGGIAGGVPGAPVYRQHVNAGGPQLLGVCACLPRGPVALTARSPGAPAFHTLSCWSPSGRPSPWGQAQAMLSPAGFPLAHAGARWPGASRPGGHALRGGACVAPPLGVVAESSRVCSAGGGAKAEVWGAG